MSRKGLYIFLALGLVAIIVFMIFGSQDKEVLAVVNEGAYYVEASNNVFSLVAKLCDDACYYLISSILGAIEGVFGNFLN